MKYDLSAQKYDVLSKEEKAQLVQGIDVIDQQMPGLSVAEKSEVFNAVIEEYLLRIQETISLNIDPEGVSAVFAEETDQDGPTDTAKYAEFLNWNKRKGDNRKDSAVMEFKGPKKASLHTADINYYGKINF